MAAKRFLGLFLKSSPIAALSSMIVLVALAAPAAGAAFRPRLIITVDPPTAGAVPQFTEAVAQDPSETPIRMGEIDYPPDMGIPPHAPVVPPCPARQFPHCPTASTIGFGVVMNSLGTFSGPNVFGGLDGFRPHIDKYIYLSPALPPVDAVGHVEVTAHGLVATEDNPVLSTNNLYSLTYFGGSRGLIANPIRCGPHVFVGRFTSTRGEGYVSRAMVQISGCPQIAPIISLPRLIRGGRAEVRFEVNRTSGVRVSELLPHGRSVVIWKHVLGRGAVSVHLPTRPALARIRWIEITAAAPGGRTSATRMAVRGPAKPTPTLPTAPRLAVTPRDPKATLTVTASLLRARGQGMNLRLGESIADADGTRPPPETAANLWLPRGLKLNWRLFPSCPQALLAYDQAALCPAGSQVGSGKALIDGRPVVSTAIPARIQLFNGGRGALLLHAHPTLGPAVTYVLTPYRSSRPYGLRFDERISLLHFPLFDRYPAPTIARMTLTVGTTLELDNKLIPFIAMVGRCQRRKLPLSAQLSFAAGTSLRATRALNCP